MRALLLSAALAAAAPVAAHEIVSVTSRPGVTQSFVILGGRIGLQREAVEVKFRAASFLVRAAPDFASHEVLPVAMDTPSEQNELTDEYRFGKAQTADARAVIGELKRRFPGLPLYVVGTSRGTISAAVLGRELGGDIAGVALTSTMFGSSKPRRQAPNLRGFDYGTIGAPLLLVHHREDGCEHTPYSGAARLASRYRLVSVTGGKPAESGPCEPFAAHGYFGREAETVAAIAAWMLHQPFPKDIE